jgi:hypothetical protein
MSDTKKLYRPYPPYQISDIKNCGQFISKGDVVEINGTPVVRHFDSYHPTEGWHESESAAKRWLAGHLEEKIVEIRAAIERLRSEAEALEVVR